MIATDGVSLFSTEGCSVMRGLVAGGGSSHVLLFCAVRQVIRSPDTIPKSLSLLSSDAVIIVLPWFRLSCMLSLNIEPF